MTDTMRESVNSVIRAVDKLREMEREADLMTQEAATESGLLDECERLYYELGATIEQAAQRQGGEAVAKVVSGYSGDPDTRGSKSLEALDLSGCEVGDKLYTAPQPQPAVPEKHKDDRAVERFAKRMKAKLKKARNKGRGGWDKPHECSENFLAKCLGDHLAKTNDGNWVDLANFCMMLGERRADPKHVMTAVARAFESLNAQMAGKPQPDWTPCSEPGPSRELLETLDYLMGQVDPVCWISRRQAIWAHHEVRRILSNGYDKRPNPPEET